MAVDWKAEDGSSLNLKRGAVTFIDPKDVVIKPELRGRTIDPDIAGLISSIRSNGQIQPVEVRYDGGRPVLVVGFSRWRAISAMAADRASAGGG